jgi:1-acyl-sn-glycerol-3-phosphate acyltransferase
MMLRDLTLAAVRAFTALRVSGYRPGDRPRIYCANHTSHADALLLLSALPRGQRDVTHPVAAADYWRSSPLRIALAETVFSTVFIERSGPTLNPLASACATLRHRHSLVFFPEGTRGAGDSLQTLKPGVFALARAFPEAEVVPVWITGAHRLLPKGAWLALPAACSVTFGEPLRWRAAEDAGAFLNRLSASMLKLRPARPQAWQPVWQR